MSQSAEIPAREIVKREMDSQNDAQPAHTKVLVSAFACGPNRGSEPGNGWNWTVQAAKHHDVWLLTSNLTDVQLSEELHCEPLGVKLVRHEVPFWPSRWINPLRAVKLYYLLWQITVLPTAIRLNRRIRFDVVHHVTFNSIEGPGYLWMLDAPFVWGPVGGAQEPPPSLMGYFRGRGRVRELIRIFRKRLIPFSPTVRSAVRTAHTILVANAETERVLRRCGARNLVRSIDVGYEPAAVTSAENEPRNEGLVVLWAGLLIERKGPALALDAIEYARNQGIDVRLLMAGDGPLEGPLRELVRQRGIECAVEFLGPLSHPEMESFYRKGDVFLFSSLHDTSGTVVLEAMSHCLPVITLDQHGASDMVGHDCGVRVAPESRNHVLHAFAEAFRFFIENPDRRREMGKAARRRVELQFAWNTKAPVLEAIYASAVRSRQPAEHAVGSQT